MCEILKGHWLFTVHVTGISSMIFIGRWPPSSHNPPHNLNIEIHHYIVINHHHHCYYYYYYYYYVVS